MAENNLDLQIRGQIIGFLNGTVDAPTLYRWLTPATWEAERWASADTAGLARSLQLLLDEFQHGDWHAEELKSQLRGLVGIVGSGESVLASAGSGSATETTEFALGLSGVGLTSGWRRAGRSLETAFS